jgi:hypothetical protein
MASGRVFRGIATGLTVLLLTEACASRAPHLALDSPPTAVRLGQVSAGLAARAVEARIEDSHHPQAPRVLAVRVHAENGGTRPVRLYRDDIVLEAPDGTIRSPEDPWVLAGPAPGDGEPADLGGLGPLLMPVAVVVALIAATAGYSADRERSRRVPRAQGYEARSFPRWATLEPGQSASGFVFFAARAGASNPTRVDLRIEDRRLAADPEDDRAEEASPWLRSVRVRLRDGSVVRPGTPQ